MSGSEPSTKSPSLVAKAQSLLRQEALGAERWYKGSTRALKTYPTEAVACFTQGFDESEAQFAPFAPATPLGCSCTLADFETSLPTQALVAVLNELASRGIVKSFQTEPSRIARLSPTLSVDGFLLFTHVHILPIDLLQAREKYKFLLGELPPGDFSRVPPWSVERARVR